MTKSRLEMQEEARSILIHLITNGVVNKHARDISEFEDFPKNYCKTHGISVGCLVSACIHPFALKMNSRFVKNSEYVSK